MKTRISIVGSTGSIGTQTLDVAAAHNDRLTVVGIGGRNRVRLAEQARRFGVPLVAVATADTPAPDEAIGPGWPEQTTVLTGADALVTLATDPAADIVVVATVGKAGLDATLAAVRAGKKVAIANKEVLVMAGAIITAEATAHGAKILPIDSEHSALWQCLRGEERAGIARLILTASGGALRDRNPAELERITPEEALRHPTWVMGPKITIDSATLMNKGLEVLEARWLFDLPIDRIDVVMHPTSVVHSLVQFRDGVVKAQLGVPDMKTAIQFAFSYPARWTTTAPQLDITHEAPLQFAQPAVGKYPCLDLAIAAGRQGGTYPAVLCGADEVAVELFLQRAVPFTAIARLVEAVLDQHAPGDERDLAAVVAADAWARERCRAIAGV